ncbi:MAG: hypothetical protein LBG14_05145 [Treponema sp.]|jgi:hypothetical protein|nr:hypothetical protein [Treponema sp.]
MIKRFLYMLSCLGAVSCAASAARETYVPPTLELIGATPAQRPAWVDETPKSPSLIYFVGMAERGDEAEAREAARRNGAAQAAGFYGSLIQGESVEHTVWSASSGKTLQDYINIDDTLSSYINTTIAEVSDAAYYTEYYRSRTNQRSFKVWALCQISRAKAEADIANFARNISEPYGNLLSGMPTVQAALTIYGTILAALDANPLHKAVAYYGSEAKRVNLFHYLEVETQKLVASITVEPIPAITIMKNDSVVVSAVITSSVMDLGPLECSLEIYGADAKTPVARSSATSVRSALLFRIDAHRLPLGSYTAGIKALGKYPVGQASIEVTPVQAALQFMGNSIEENERGVLRRSVEQALQQYGAPAQIADTADRYAVAITLEAAQQSSLLVAGTVELSFTLDGKSLVTSGRKHISETNQGRFAAKAAEHIRGYEEFFREVGKSLDQ